MINNLADIDGALECRMIELEQILGGGGRPQIIASAEVGGASAKQRLGREGVVRPASTKLDRIDGAAANTPGGSGV